MEYFKIIVDNNIVGAVTSTQFVRYNVATDMLLRCNKVLGEYVTYNNILYRDTWMNSTVIELKYTPALVVSIEEQEYNYIIEALKTDEQIEVEEEEDIEPYVPIENTDTTSIDFIRSSKLNEMSYQCRQAIENGIDIIAQGKTRHFSLTTQDQLNLMSLNVMAQTQDIIPYHADGEQCIYYTAEEIKQIVAAANSHKIWHTTYYNALKAYINSLETIEEISAITYGTPIPDEFKTEVLKVIE